jgi:hypothetical protein
LRSVDGGIADVRVQQVDDIQRVEGHAVVLQIVVLPLIQPEVHLQVVVQETVVRAEFERAQLLGLVDRLGMLSASTRFLATRTVSHDRSTPRSPAG